MAVEENSLMQFGGKYMEMREPYPQEVVWVIPIEIPLSTVLFSVSTFFFPVSARVCIALCF